MLSDRLTEDNSAQSAISYFLACSGLPADFKRVFIRSQLLFPPSKASPRLKQTHSSDDAQIILPPWLDIVEDHLFYSLREQYPYFMRS